MYSILLHLFDKGLWAWLEDLPTNINHKSGDFAFAMQSCLAKLSQVELHYQQEWLFLNNYGGQGIRSKVQSNADPSCQHWFHIFISNVAEWITRGTPLATTHVGLSPEAGKSLGRVLWTSNLRTML